jgi:hypothetical protein
MKIWTMCNEKFITLAEVSFESTGPLLVYHEMTLLWTKWALNM